jgi:hypothetical protein
VPEVPVPIDRIPLALLIVPWVAATACSGDIASTSGGTSGNTPAGQAGAGAAGNGTGPGAAGTPGLGGGGSAAPTPGEACATVDTGAGVLRRLSRDEYRLTLQDLFQLEEPPAVDRVPEDAQQNGFRTIAALQGLSDQHLLAYLEVAEQLGAELMANPTRRDRVLGCDATESGCLRKFVERFGRVAFRRALSAEEASSLAEAAQTAATDDTDAYRFAIEALLTSPSFLFRVEAGDGAALAELSPSELATRLAFTLWGRGPSAELLDRAEAGDLSTAEGVAAVAEEMLAAPQARAGFRGFFKQWLGFEHLRVPSQQPAGFSPELLPDMVSETERFLDDFAWQPGVRFTDALSANFTYLTPALGDFYGIAVQGTGFTRVELPAGHARAGTGLLTHASVISSKTDADLISHRGAFLRDALLCHKLVIPSELQQEIQGSVAGLSYLEVIALRNREQPCAGCHALIDPIGVAFAQFDGIGHHDASVDVGEYGLATKFLGLDEPEFATLAELGGKLAEAPEVQACIAQKVFVYTQGREPGPEDACALATARERFTQSGGRFPAILAAFVESPAFRLRRAQTSEVAP